jgi:type IV secretory pathway VirB10-like protein
MKMRNEKSVERTDPCRRKEFFFCKDAKKKTKAVTTATLERMEREAEKQRTETEEQRIEAKEQRASARRMRKKGVERPSGREVGLSERERGRSDERERKREEKGFSSLQKKKPLDEKNHFFNNKKVAPFARATKQFFFRFKSWRSFF